jgi:PAS domain S-box-containing protein
LRDLSLNWKVTLMLTAALSGIMAMFPLAFLPFQRQQRARLLSRDERLLSVLREKYTRDLIYDVLSENKDSLAVNLADFARQPEILWVRVESEVAGLAATGDPRVQQLLLGRDLSSPGQQFAKDTVLLVAGDGRGTLVGPGGRPILVDLPIVGSHLPLPDAGRHPSEPFQEIEWNGESVLRHQAPLQAGGESFGRLDVLFSLAADRQSESQTRTLFWGLVGMTFLLLLLLLNFLLSRIVIAPVHRVQLAMSQASKGQLEVRLPADSRDEIGTMAEAFNRMVGDLALSKRNIEGYSRDLEGMVRERTGELVTSQQKLRDLKNHLETVISHVATGVVSLDSTGRITTFNGRAGEILSISRAAAEGCPIEEVLSAPHEGLLALIDGVRRGEATVKKGQVYLRLAQGRRSLSVVASALPDAAGGSAGTVVVFDDLTQILASQRLEAWKEAVERVIHEIKNPLTPVGLAAQTLRSAFAEDRKKFDELFPSAIEMILAAVKDLKDLISEFSRFSRIPKGEQRRLSLNAIVAEVLRPFEHSTIAGVSIRRHLAPDLPDVEADREQLKRVLLNIINNAIEAMEDRGGVVTLATERPRGSPFVVLSVGDEGVGIEDVDRIFEPYYTTKAKGTGLGLAIARQIVAEHGGTIAVRSQLDVGTTVEIALPVARDSLEHG